MPKLPACGGAAWPRSRGRSKKRGSHGSMGAARATKPWPRSRRGPPSDKAGGGTGYNRAVSRFYLTTAIDYVNSRPHLGHALEKIAADVIARYKRLMGVETRFVIGNDEHSQNVFKKARELGLDPLEYCDRMEREFRDAWQRLDISYDDFIRTTEPRHRAGVQELMRRCRDAGDIYEGVYEGWYCVGCEAFKQEKDLVDGNCPIHLTKPDWIKEKNYFFRLSKYAEPLLKHIA